MAETKHLFDDYGLALRFELGLVPNIATAARLAGLGATNLHDRASRFLCAEIFVKCDYAVHLGDGDIEQFRQYGYQISADI